MTIEELLEIEEIKNLRIMYSHYFDGGQIDDAVRVDLRHVEQAAKHRLDGLRGALDLAHHLGGMAGRAHPVQALDLARRSGPVRDIVIPPCPELLVQLQQGQAVAGLAGAAQPASTTRRALRKRQRRWLPVLLSLELGIGTNLL